MNKILARKLLVALCLLLLAFIPTAHAETPNRIPSNVKAIAAFGEDARMLASIVAENNHFDMISEVVEGSKVIIVSELKEVDVSMISEALQEGATLIAMNLPAGNGLISPPALQEHVAKVDYTIDLEHGTSLQGSTVSESARTLNPEYWITVIRNDKGPSVSTFASIVDSPQEREKLFTAAAEGFDEIAPLTTFPEVGTEWSKRAEVSDLWDLAGDDQLYTRHEIYSLKYWDEVTQKEYWRIDPYIDHWLPSYVQNLGHCGPYMNKRQIIVDADSAELYDYDPPTTVENAGASVSIGFTVTTGGVGVNVGYSWSWSNPGVRYDASADYVNSKITWDETFGGPNYSLWPWYPGPTEASHNSYNAKTTAIMRTPLGSGLYLAKLQSQWVKYDDVLTYVFPFWLRVDRTITTYTSSWTPGQLASIFKTVIKIQAWPTTDYYSRSHGIAIDRDLPESWWTLPGYQFLVTHQAFTATITAYLLPGNHFVEYAASGYVPNYAWHARIYVNNVFIIEGDVGRYSANHLRGYFNTWWI